MPKTFEAFGGKPFCDCLPVVVARSANEARFFLADRSTPLDSASLFFTSSALAPKLNPANGEGLAGSAAGSTLTAVMGVVNLAKLKVDVVAGASTAGAASGFLPKLKPLVGVDVDVTGSAGFPKLKPLTGAGTLKADAGAASFFPKLNPLTGATGATGAVIGVTLAPKVKPDLDEVAAGVLATGAGLTPNLKPDTGDAVEEAGARLNPPPLTAGPLLNLKEELADDEAVPFCLTSSSLPGCTV